MTHTIKSEALPFNRTNDSGVQILTGDTFHKLSMEKNNIACGSIIIEMLNTYCENKNEKESIGNDHQTIHSTALSYIDHYGRDIWNTAYTFVVVRHPLQRQVYNYFFIAAECVDMGVCEDRLIQPFSRGNRMKLLTGEEKVNAFHEWVLDLITFTHLVVILITVLGHWDTVTKK